MYHPKTDHTPTVASDPREQGGGVYYRWLHAGVDMVLEEVDRSDLALEAVVEDLERAMNRLRVLGLRA